MWLAGLAIAVFSMTMLIFEYGEHLKPVSDALSLDDRYGISYTDNVTLYLFVFTGLASLIAAVYMFTRQNQDASYRWNRLNWLTWYIVELPIVGRMSVFEIFVLLVWLVFQAVGMWLYWLNRKQMLILKGTDDMTHILYEICSVFGVGFGINFAFLLTPISKHSFWLELFDVSFERAVRVHRWLGFLTFVMAFVHSIVGLATYIYADGSKFYYCMGWSQVVPESSFCGMMLRMNKTGQVSLAGGVALCITSLPVVRRWSYQVFYYTHIIGALFFFVFGLIHAKATYTYLFPCLATYVVDKIISVWRRSRACTVISYSIDENTACTKIEVALDKSSPLPHHGQWYHINVKDASVLQWHPISAAEVDEGNHSVTFYIREFGDWSKRVRTSFQEGKVLDVSLDGPFGSTHTRHSSYMANESALFVCGGIGITAQTLALDAALRSEAFKYVGLRWMVTGKAFFEQHKSYLEQMAARGADIHVYITQDGKDLANAIELGDRAPTTWKLQTNGAIARYRLRLGSPLSKAVLNIVAGVTLYYGFIWAYGHAAAAGRSLVRTEILGISMTICIAGALAAAYFASLVAFSIRMFVTKGLICGHMAVPLSKTKAPEPMLKPNENVEAAQKIEVTIGRPHLLEVLQELAEKLSGPAYRGDQSSFAVGLSLCGPEELVSDAISSANTVSRRTQVKFIVDEETFNF